MAQVNETHGHAAGDGRSLLRQTLGEAWLRMKDFAGLGGDATYLWPRWLVLRAVGLVFIVVFGGIIEEGQVLVGPHGLTPLAEILAGLHERYPHAIVAFLRAPGLFWAGAGAGMIAAAAWGGLVAAVALVLNLWPRMALFGCWLALLSFVTTWGVFSASQVDQLMLETALLCIPFAPAGFRPGLGAASPPRPIAVFMIRWLLFRIMFEAGLVKILTHDSQWRNLTAMEIMYETSPFPTILGYYAHQLPHAFHLGEIALTFAAEIVAPLLAVFGGRRGRWRAIAVWTIFQSGIHLTNNFGWLNTASIALGVLLLDDQMLATAAARLRLRRAGDWLAGKAARLSAPVPGPWSRHSLRAALWLHFVLGLYFFRILYGQPVDKFPYVLAKPLKFVFEDFHSANPYTLYAGLTPVRYGIEFEGSNDAGVTWRTYEYHYQPQRVDRMPPFIAPWYPRFETTLHVEATRPEPSALYEVVAAQLLQRDPGVTGLFLKDPFVDHPPAIVRILAYQFKFVDPATHRKTGAFWRKELKGEYLPMMYLDAQGQVAAAASTADEVRLMAAQGNAGLQHQLGLMYLNGDGVEKNVAEAAKWLRQAAEQGVAPAQSILGLMYAAGAGLPKDEVEALAWFNLAALAGEPEAVKNRELAAGELGPQGVLQAQLRSREIAAGIESRRKAK
jgi:hypothetical protein